jgi:hypothetical protein
MWSNIYLSFSAHYILEKNDVFGDYIEMIFSLPNVDMYVGMYVPTALARLRKATHDVLIECIFMYTLR